MNQGSFVKKIKLSLRDFGIKSLLKLFADPPGRKPREKIRKLSEWYNNLPSDDKEKIKEIMEETVDFTIFGFFCILDHVRFLEDEEEKTEFILSAVKNSHSIRLNDPHKEELHNLYNSLTQEQDK